MERSSCHGVAVKVASADEGTNHYVCTECEKACDILPTEEQLIKQAEDYKSKNTGGTEYRAYLSPEEQAKLQNQCDHVGFHTAPSQSVFVADDVFVVISHVCINCGITIINTQVLPGSGKKSPIANIH